MVETTADDDSNANRSTTASSHSNNVLAGHARHTIADVQDTYREQAGMLGRVEWLNRRLTRRYRRPQFRQASGRVLDVACGLATNAQFVPESTDYVGIDVSVDVLKEAEQHNEDLRFGKHLREMDAQNLDFSDDSFDTVISSLSTCTFPDPIAALSEMGRVCKPTGRILLLEHGRSNVGPIARFQDWRADAHFQKHSCRWNQDPLHVVAESPLTIVDSASSLLGIVTAIEARPA